MKYLFKDWKRIAKAAAAKEVMLFLDYDGTLTPMAPTPSQALIPPQVRKTLLEFSRTPGCSLAVVSGRALADIRKMVGVPGIFYVGNHGLEIEGPDISFENLMTPDTRVVMGKIKADLEQRISGIPGAFLEDKHFTLSLHYRLAEEKKEPVVRKIFTQVCRPLARGKKIKVSFGKKVLEVRPPFVWDKGNAVSWLLAKRRYAAKGKEILPFGVGDDVTDEDVFKALKGKGITVVVGKGRRSVARYYVENPAEVHRLIVKILELKKS